MFDLLKNLSGWGEMATSGISKLLDIAKGPACNTQINQPSICS